MKKAILKRESESETNPKVIAWELTESFRRQAIVVAAHKEASAVHEENPDDLTLLKGIAGTIQDQLNQAGVFTFQQIANWTPDDVEAFNELLAFKGRIQREKWISQASKLAADAPETTESADAVAEVVSEAEAEAVNEPEADITPVES